MIPLEVQVFRRVFHQIAALALAQLARRDSIDRHQRFSDRAPLSVAYELGL